MARGVGAILTLVLGMVSAAYFGTSAEKDCYLVAQNVPGLVTTFLAGGLYTALLVTLAAIGRREGLRGQIAFARTTLWHLALVLLPFILLATLGSRLVIAATAPGFGPAQIVLASRLLVLTALGTLGAVAFVVVRCLFETRSRFAVPAIAHLTIGVTALATLVVAAKPLGIFTLAVGPLVGTLLAVLAMWALISRVLKDPSAFQAASPVAADRALYRRTFWVAFLPMTLGANLGPINILVDNAFASFLPPGNITLLGFAFVIISNAELLTTYSLAEISFPRMATAALDGSGELARILKRSVRYMTLLTAPIAVGIVVFGLPLSRFLFERGRFGPDSTAGVARLLAFYSPEVVFMGYVVLFTRVLFARQKAVPVAAVALGAILANAALDYLLMKPLGAAGIALATTLVTILQFAVFLPMVRREVGALGGLDEIRRLVRIAGSAVLMGLTVLLFSVAFERTFDLGSQWARFLEVLAGLAIGGLSYVALLRWMGLEEVEVLVKRAIERLAGGGAAG